MGSAIDALTPSTDLGLLRFGSGSTGRRIEDPTLLRDEAQPVDVLDPKEPLIARPVRDHAAVEKDARTRMLARHQGDVRAVPSGADSTFYSGPAVSLERAVSTPLRL